MAQTITPLTSQNITTITCATTLAGTLAVIVFVPDPNGSRYRIKVLRLNNPAGASKDYLALQRLSLVTATGGIAPGNTITASTLVQTVWDSSLPAGPGQDQTNLGDEFRVLQGEVLGVKWITAATTNDPNAGYICSLTLYHAV